MSKFVQDQKNNHSDDQIKNQLVSSDQEESSVAFDDLEEEEYILLKDSNKKSAFLLKTGILILVYFIIMTIACLYCRMDQRSAKNFQRTLRATDLLLVYALIGNGVFLAFGFGGKYLRDYATFGYVIFCVVEFILCVGFYFYLEEVHRLYYQPYGHYLLINFMCLCIMQIVFCIMLVIKMKKNIHKFLLIAAIMIVVDVVSIKVIEAMWTTNPLTMIELVIIFLMHTFIAVFICINSYLLVKKRGDKFYEHESFYAFFTYFTDLISFFWIDLLKLITKAKKKKLILKKPKKKQRKRTIKKVETKKEQPKDEGVHQRQNVQQNQIQEEKKEPNKIKTTVLESQISKKDNQQNQDIETNMKQDRINMDDSRDYEKLTTSNLD